MKETFINLFWITNVLNLNMDIFFRHIFTGKSVLKFGTITWSIWTVMWCSYIKIFTVLWGFDESKANVPKDICLLWNVSWKLDNRIKLLDSYRIIAHTEWWHTQNEKHIQNDHIQNATKHMVIQHRIVTHTEG